MELMNYRKQKDAVPTDCLFLCRFNFYQKYFRQYLLVLRSGNTKVFDEQDIDKYLATVKAGRVGLRDEYF